MRKAISRRRPLKRASNRFATLLHAISSTRLTAANRVAKAGTSEMLCPFPDVHEAIGAIDDLVSLLDQPWVKIETY